MKNDRSKNTWTHGGDQGSREQNERDQSLLGVVAAGHVTTAIQLAVFNSFGPIGMDKYLVQVQVCWLVIVLCQLNGVYIILVFKYNIINKIQ